MIYVTRKADFSAAHRLYNPSWSDKQNDEVFGKCNNPNGHGHNYILEVTVRGDVDDSTGYLVDLKKLKEVIRVRVIDKVDHKNLNTDVEFLHGIIPTAENIAIAIWGELKDAIPSGTLHEIRLQETERNIVTYRGE